MTTNVLSLNVNCVTSREGFPNVRQVLYNVVDQLRQNGQEAGVDVDKLCSGAMWDAIGKCSVHMTLLSVTEICFPL